MKTRNIKQPVAVARAAAADKEARESHEVSGSHQRLVLRLEALEARVASLEGAAVVGGGFRCACCKMQRPSDWFIYEAWNPETKQTVAPLCGACVKRSAVGGLPWKIAPLCGTCVKRSAVGGLPWKYQGPFNQKAWSQAQRQREGAAMSPTEKI